MLDVFAIYWIYVCSFQCHNSLIHQKLLFTFFTHQDNSYGYQGHRRSKNNSSTDFGLPWCHQVLFKMLERIWVLFVPFRFFGVLRCSKEWSAFFSLFWIWSVPHVPLIFVHPWETLGVACQTLLEYSLGWHLCLSRWTWILGTSLLSPQKAHLVWLSLMLHFLNIEKASSRSIPHLFLRLYHWPYG